MAVQIFAHRGASFAAPENTLPAFEKAAALHVDGVELDVHLTTDGRLVVIHDDTVDRTTNGQGRVNRMTLEQLRALDASAGRQGYGGVRIPTLAEVYRLLEPTHLLVNVELKENRRSRDGYAVIPKVLALEESAGMSGRVFYSSFNPFLLRELKRRSPQSKTALLYKVPLARVWKLAARLVADAIHPKDSLLRDTALVSQCHTRGLAVRPWTADEPAVMEELFRQQVDAVITNCPEQALHLRIDTVPMAASHAYSK
ncbi:MULTISPECIES: glycerophosphodiester phosphodiesterase [Caproicibacterium]|uniref:Glycerophosphodiester phosphodiesterase n=1 Tax=Caproicibacterium lactatifermentans TaxID=2666138 RepID=A0A859DUE3_9FIRM|nr:glycerophosphodiester phosphodiesterase [Caproicibacterium lactatifermentans]ARP50625.1 hypothetical protein B6259_06870 [Ruminococcaceae bacterium CPB6]MDD4807261.1 glycerophosphodiester phosphodiesterase [Oscillospiraceae bacterium]QKN23641.1 glycerophosphodiester phosphodiesterase [Caproicibacterium lactatifermentans]QKO29686.1 glycerophosphodiester phosphodiesterase [Caproicibacterium lactatifermentans]